MLAMATMLPLQPLQADPEILDIGVNIIDPGNNPGPVVVEKNQMTIKAPNGVTLKNNFTLKKGASLVIDPTIQHIIHAPVEQ